MTSAIPKRLFVSRKNINRDKGILDDGKPVALGPNTERDLCKMNCKDYYRLFIEGKYMCPTGFRKWSNFFDRDVTKECKNCLKRTKAICQDTKVLQTTFKLQRLVSAAHKLPLFGLTCLLQRQRVNFSRYFEIGLSLTSH